MLLYPVPKKVEYRPGLYKGQEKKVEYIDTLGREEYKLEINDKGIFIECLDEEGLFRAQTTLKQIASQSEEGLPFISIHDKPDFKDRGVMLDISRCKVPTLETLLKLVDMFADLKINQLQLYIEGFSFAYESYPDTWEGITPITGREIKELDKYCKERFIDLVPNQNSYGHMMPWLSRPEFRHLAMCPDGFEFDLFGKMDNGWSLDLENDEAISFLISLYEDLLKNFTSKRFNIGGDETLDLGQGKSKEACEKYGKGKVYFDAIMKIYNILKDRGLTMMFWGDIIKKYPDYAAMLPKDLIALNWGYDENSVSKESCMAFKDAGIPYYVCPSTNSYNSILGRTKRMLGNVKTSVANGIKHGATGVLVTDWGDFWHLHYQPISYPGFAFAAGLSWNASSDAESLLVDYLNKFIFKDKNNIMGQLMLDIGLYNKEEIEGIHSTRYGRTYLTQTLVGTLDNRSFIGAGTKEVFDRLEVFFDCKLALLEQTDMRCHDATLIADEIKAGIKILKYAIELGRYKIGEITEICHLKDMQDDMVEAHSKVWLARNKSSRMQEGIEAIRKV